MHTFQSTGTVEVSEAPTVAGTQSPSGPVELNTDPAFYSLQKIEDMNTDAVDGYAEEAEFRDRHLEIPTEQIGAFRKKVIPGSYILDQGCGTARYVRQLLRPDDLYVGIDVSEPTLELAREKHPDLHFLYMSYKDHRFEDDTFDAIWSCCSLSYEPKRNIAAVLKDSLRILKPGGHYGIVLPEYHMSDEEMYEDLFGRLGYLSYRAFYMALEFKALLKFAGFGRVAIEHYYSSKSMMFMTQKPLPSL